MIDYLEAGKKYSNTQLILEIKDHKDTFWEEESAIRTIEVVRKMKVQHHIEYLSFSRTICQTVKKHSPKNPVFYLNGSLSPTEIAHFGWDGMDYHYDEYLKNSLWIEEAKSLGIATNSWTVNGEDLMRKMLSLGLDYLTTDEPEILQQLVLQSIVSISAE